MEKTFRSLIRRRIPRDLYKELIKLVYMYDVDNNAKGYELKRLLTEYHVEYSSLGSGTNRFGILIDGYAVKFALDVDGMIDNKREFLYSKKLYPYVVKVYECSADGLIAVTEYVEVFNLDAFYQYQKEMRRILADISTSFLVGDVGITAKNYINWGIRHTPEGEEVCILDFAYIYSVKYGIFRCTCDDTTLLEYDKDFVGFQCPRCRKRYTFGDVRRKVTRKAQDAEIGDISKLGYVLDAESKTLPINPAFSIENTKKEPMDSYKMDVLKRKDNDANIQAIRDAYNGIIRSDDEDE